MIRHLIQALKFAAVVYATVAILAGVVILVSYIVDAVR